MENLYEKYQQSSCVCTDSRNLTPECLFVCLKGANFDGNKFAAEVLEQGAKYVITENRDLQDNPRAVVVDDALKTLQQLANYHRQQLKMPVIGITGTNGKTTTKELINAVLSTTYKTTCTKGNLNNHIGVPLTLLSIKPTDEMAIVEMGANHVGEIDDLCKIAEPTFGLITNIGVAHIEGFGSKENIILTKKALYQHVIANNGTLFINETDMILRDGLNYDKIVFYGKEAEKQIVGMNPYLRIRIGQTEVDTHLTGSYNIWNFMGAAAIGRYFRIPDNVIAKALGDYEPSNHRSQVNRIGSNVIISDYYNANLTSMTAALKNLGQLDHPRKVAVLGDMRELGELSVEAHTEIFQLVNNLHIEGYFVGTEFAKVVKGNNFANVEEANAYFTAHPLENAMVLIKGSNSMHLNKLTAILGE
jgi:UDP-N-acetylmuramoyl-tripeptide--D-alanyl-D-alanine ligase